MKLSEYVAQKRGRVAEIAAVLQVSGSLVTQWAAGKQVSAERCAAVEKATGAAVRRWDVRPDDWHLIWPELIGTEGAPEVPQTATEARDAA